MARTEYRVTTRTTASAVAGVVAVVLIVAGFALPAFAGRGLIQNLFFILTMLVLAQFWNLLAGYGGLVSVGQQAFVGLRGYALFGAAILWGLDPVPALILSGGAAFVVAIPTAFFAFRLQGAYFAIGTWVVAEVVRLSVAQWKAVGGGTGTSLPRDAVDGMAGLETVKRVFDASNAAARDILAYWLALTLCIATIGGVYWLFTHETRTCPRRSPRQFQGVQGRRRRCGPDEMGGVSNRRVWHRDRGWPDIPAKGSVTIRVHVIGPRKPIQDHLGEWAGIRETRDSGAVLTRPDQHVAYRVATIPADPVAELRRVMTTILAV